MTKLARRPIGSKHIPQPTELSALDKQKVNQNCLVCGGQGKYVALFSDDSEEVVVCLCRKGR